MNKVEKCKDGSCGLLPPDSSNEVCCFQCVDREKCNFPCDMYEEDKSYDYSKCAEHIIDSEED